MPRNTVIQKYSVSLHWLSVVTIPTHNSFSYQFSNSLPRNLQTSLWHFAIPSFSETHALEFRLREGILCQDAQSSVQGNLFQALALRERPGCDLPQTLRGTQLLEPTLLEAALPEPFQQPVLGERHLLEFLAPDESLLPDLPGGPRNDHAPHASAANQKSPILARPSGRTRSASALRSQTRVSMHIVLSPGTIVTGLFTQRGALARQKYSRMLQRMGFPHFTTAKASSI